jgi:hypothetical protein
LYVGSPSLLLFLEKPSNDQTPPRGIIVHFLLTGLPSLEQRLSKMSGHPQGQYEDGYGHEQYPNDAHYQDEHNQGYQDHYDYNQQQQHGGDGYYDES